jgi:hypothetical protein
MQPRHWLEKHALIRLLLDWADRFASAKEVYGFGQYDYHEPAFFNGAERS